ncbi:MAG TPA: zf-HC2 domain-containing protein [Pyrinomonadaceae bacterium]|nr:zf-HC2 domain-containing protein [Pyrinomonadaceae bacterium]
MKDLEQKEQQAIRNFLLGDLDEEDRQSLEERFMSDSEYRTDVLMAESELLEAYVDGALSEEEQAKFRNHYLSTPRQEKQLRATRALRKAAGRRRPVQPTQSLWQRLAKLFNSANPRLQFASVAACVVIVVVSSGLILQALLKRGTAGLREELAQLNAPENLARTNDSVLAVTFPPVTLRDENILPKFTLTPGINAVRFNVPMARDEYPSYRVELRTVEGKHVVDFETRARPQNGVLPLQLPAHILTPNDYSLVIRVSKSDGQVEDIGDFNFRLLPPQ